MPHHDVAALSDLPDGAMHAVTIDDTQILLIRDGETIHAIGGICPHAGAPLEQGVRHGDRIVCPWHKATFCIRTGALLEPPAVDSLPHYKARIAGQRILVTVPPEQPEPPEPSADQRTFVDHRCRRGRGACRANLAAKRFRRPNRHARPAQPRSLRPYAAEQVSPLRGAGWRENATSVTGLLPASTASNVAPPM